MRKKFFALALWVLTTVALLTACLFNPSDRDSKPKLEAPSGLNIINDMISWDLVPNATGYTLDVNGEEHSTTGMQFDLSAFAPAEYAVKVKATGGNSYSDSQYSESVTYTLWGSELLDLYQQTYMTYTDKIPVMRFTVTNSAGQLVEVENKRDWLTTIVNIESPDNQYDINDWEVQIRGRGNTSFSQGLEHWGKVPYRIRQKGSNPDNWISVFGRPAMRNWALIPVHSDKTLMRNYLAYMLGRSLEGMDYNPTIIFVELYYNDDYRGVYCMTDHNEAGEFRADVMKYEIDENGNLTDVGFYIEIDDRAGQNDFYGGDPDVEGRDFFRIVDNRALYRTTYKFVLKYPQYDSPGFEDNPELFNQAFDYIENYVRQVSGAIFANNRTMFLELCDEQSFIDFFTVHELFKNTDAHSMSLFFSRKIGGKIKMGNVWDFDIAAGNTDYIAEVWNGAGRLSQFEAPQTIGPERWHVARINDWFRALMERDAIFKANFAARYKLLHDRQISLMLNTINTIAANIKPAAERNFERWDILKMRIWPNPEPVWTINTFDGQVEYLKNFLAERAEWLYVAVNKGMRE